MIGNDGSEEFHQNDGQLRKVSHTDGEAQNNIIAIVQLPVKDIDIFNNYEETLPYPEVGKFIESSFFQIFITMLTVYALFGDDIRVMAFTKEADIGFDAMNIICLVYYGGEGNSFIYQIAFSFEIGCSIITKPGYLFSFFFWLDSISTISLLLDIQLFTVAVGLSGGGGAKNTAQLARAGRASRVGTKFQYTYIYIQLNRAGRVVRLVRLIRIAKLYKAAAKNKQDNAQHLLELKKKKKKVHALAQVSPREDAQENDQNGQDEENKDLKESRVSKALSDITTKRVIIIILSLLFIVPLFGLEYFFDPPMSMDFQCHIFGKLGESKLSDKALLQKTFNDIIQQHSMYQTPLIYFANPYKFIDNYESPEFNDVRTEEQEISLYTMDSNLVEINHSDWIAEGQISLDDTSMTIDVLGIVNTRQINQIKAVLGFTRTIFVCIVLSFGSMMFSKDANDLALRPIERMIDTVNKIAKNPNTAVELKLTKDTSNANETVKIENAIIKIGMLLALGFGDAGAEIIGSNMAKGGDVDPMLPGSKKCAIYGFCDIRNFTDATEQLQEDVMLFVNNIAFIVHAMVDRYAGAANKNIGDAFLLVWKMDPQKYKIYEDGTVKFNDKKYVEQLADCSLISFMKIQAKMNREPNLLAYREDERLLKRMPGYKIKMGYGLHLGWGIEGAIGSTYKIDASYLSPNVNMSARLEAATKQYGTPLLISSDLHQHFSDALKEYTRQIDYVTVKGSIQPIGFYTIDMDVDGLPPSKDPSADNTVTKDQVAEILRNKKKNVYEEINEKIFDGKSTIENDKDLSLIMRNFNPEFNEIFGRGFKSYLNGDWQLAKKQFGDSNLMRPNDGPTTTLIEVMQEYKFISPSDWKGYRELTEK